jgi:hypothetical protein
LKRFNASTIIEPLDLRCAFPDVDRGIAKQHAMQRVGGDVRTSLEVRADPDGRSFQACPIRKHGNKLMAKYCGIISVGAIAGGGYVSTTSHDSVTGRAYASNAIPIAVELVSFRIGDKFFRKIRLCQEFVSQFIHQGDQACIYVYKQLGITDVVVGVKSTEHPSYRISFGRLVLMMFSQYLFGALFGVIPAFVLFGWLSGKLAILAMLALPSYGAWTLYQAYQQMKADFD